jgi:hypothetical protein
MVRLSWAKIEIETNIWFCSIITSTVLDNLAYQSLKTIDLSLLNLTTIIVVHLFLPRGGFLFSGMKLIVNI